MEREKHYCKCGCGKEVKWNAHKKAFPEYSTGHRPWTPERRAKSSLAQKQSSYFHTYNKTKEHSEKVSRSNSQRRLSEETKKKIANSLKGSTPSPETKLKRKITRIDSNSQWQENNSQWKGGISPKKNTGEWIKLSKEIKKRDNYTCQLCSSKQNIDVHHIDFDGDRHEPLNLISVCRKCHKRIHMEKIYVQR